MGKERTRSRKHLFLHFACLGALLLNLGGCISSPEVRDLETSLSNAGRHLSGEDFQAALVENDKVQKSSDPLGTQALFQRGLIYAHPNNPERDYDKAQDYFRTVVEQSPVDETSAQAKVLMLILSRLAAVEKEKNALRAKTDLLDKTVARQKTTIEDQKKTFRRFEGESKKNLTYIDELEQELNKLKDQIEKLKNIDLQIENVKRQAAPPAKGVQ